MARARAWIYAALSPAQIFLTAISALAAVRLLPSELLPAVVVCSSWTGELRRPPSGESRRPSQRSGEDRRHGLQRRAPAHVLLLTYPKTASTSLVNAIARWGFPPPKRFHSPLPQLAEHVRAANCTVSRWCLIVSTVRKPAALMISFFFWQCHNEANPECQELLRDTDEELDKKLFNFMRRESGSQRRLFWSQSRRLLRQAGLDFDLSALARDGVAALPNAIWVVLRFEEIGSYQTILRRWLPGLNLPHTLDHREMVASAMYERTVARFKDGSRWPQDLRAAMQADETMQLFYPGQAG